MSRDRGSITFKLDEHLEPKKWMKMLKSLEAQGWNYRSQLDDSVLLTDKNSDEIDWDGTEYSDQEIEKIISQKIRDELSFSMSIHIPDMPNESVHDDLVLHSHRQSLSLWLGDCSKEIEGQLIVDYSHYLSIFIPIVFQLTGGFGVTVQVEVDWAP